MKVKIFIEEDLTMASITTVEGTPEQILVRLADFLSNDFREISIKKQPEHE